MLGILASHKGSLEKLVNETNGARDIIGIGYWDQAKHNAISSSLDLTKMSFVISNKSVTATANQDDGWGFVPYYVYLEAGESYTFSCDTNGTWGSSGDTVEAFLMREWNNPNVRMESNNFNFTPTSSGVYALRLDVNKSGKTYTFSNINIIKKK